jgi:hypothetical protein
MGCKIETELSTLDSMIRNLDNIKLLKQRTQKGGKEPEIIETKELKKSKKEKNKVKFNLDNSY